MTRVKNVWSIRVIASAAAVLLLVAAVIPMAAVSERHATRTLTEEIEARLLLTARNLALVCSDALLEDYPELVLAPMIKDLQLERPELAFVIATDTKETIRGHADMQRLGVKFETPSDWTVAREATTHTGEQLWLGPDVLVAIAPVTLGDGQHAGRAIVGLERNYLAARVSAARRPQLTVFAAVLVIGTLGALVMVTWLLRPIGPLRRGLERIGRGDLETRLQVSGGNELGLLAHTVNRMAEQLKNAQVELVQNARLNHEMHLAQDIQASLRPPDRMDHGPFVIRGTQRAATEVGGDYYGVFDLPDGRIGLAIADVAGKGLAGCLSASMLAAFMRAYHSLIVSPTKILKLLDRQLCDALAPGTFVTMFYGVLDPQTGYLQFASAGHGPSAVYRRSTNTVEWFHPRGRPLASFRNKSRSLQVQEAAVTLEPGDLLMQFTDGINEAWHRGDRFDQFGFERVQRLLLERGANGARDVMAELHGAIDQWVGHHPRPDDETVLVIGHEGVERAVEEQEQDPLGVARGLSAIGDAELITRLKFERDQGDYLKIPADMSALLKIKPWLDDKSRRLNLNPDQNPAHIAIYEICANIVEHGYTHKRDRGIEIYWVAPTDVAVGSNLDIEAVPRCATSQLAASYFVICDGATSFRPASGASEFRTEDVIDRKGRGLGLPIVHRVADEIDYRTSSIHGNITLLRLSRRRNATTEA